MTLVNKVKLCKTCENSKHLLNMLSAEDRSTALELMINHDDYHVDENNVLRKNSNDDWLPVGVINADVEGETMPKIIRNHAGNNMFNYYINTLGKIFVAGNNSNGELGLGDTYERSAFEELIITDVKRIYIGHLCVFIVKNDNTLWATGCNDDGQLGLGDSDNRNTFTDTGIGNVKDVFTDRFSVIIIRNDGVKLAAGENFTNTFTEYN